MIKEQRNCSSERLTGTRDRKRHGWGYGAPALGITDPGGSGETAAIVPANGDRDAWMASSSRLLPGDDFGGERASQRGINSACRRKRHGTRCAGPPVDWIRRSYRCRNWARKAGCGDEQRDAEAGDSALRRGTWHVRSLAPRLRGGAILCFERAMRLAQCGE